MKNKNLNQKNKAKLKSTKWNFVIFAALAVASNNLAANSQEIKFTPRFASLLASQTFPFEETAFFSGQYINEIVRLNDGSMWIIKGSSIGLTDDDQGLPSNSIQEHKITIYNEGASLPRPEAGIKTDHYMLVAGHPATYFVEQLSNEDIPALTGNSPRDTCQGDFSRQYINEIFLLEARTNDSSLCQSLNNSMWLIKGASIGLTDDDQGLPPTKADTRIYAGASILPRPDAGVRANYFMLLDRGDPTTYFIEPVSNENLAVSIDGLSLGSVVSNLPGIDCGNDCFHAFPTGARITLTATPSADARFVNWAGDCTGTRPTCTLSMDQARSTTARFEDTRANEVRNLSLTVVGPGSLLVNPTGTACSDLCVSQFDIGSRVTLTAASPANSSFSGWGGACESAQTARTCEVTLNQATAVTATFQASAPADSRALNLHSVGVGRVISDPAGIDCGSNCRANYAAGTRIVLTAAPGYRANFLEWGGSCSGVETICTLDMSQENTAIAIFDGNNVNRSSFTWQVTEIYIATLGYAPDAEGLQHWLRQMESNPAWDAITVAQSFFDQPLVQAMYPESAGYGPFIEALYRNLFGRTPDTQGYNYWLAALESGQVSRNQMILALINGGWSNNEPEAIADMARFANRVEVGVAFADEQVRTGIQYSHLSPSNQAYLRAVGRDLLLRVTSDTATRDEAIAHIPSLLNALN